MDSNFLPIIQKVISDRGKSIVNNIAVFNSLLADYAQGKFTRERRLFVKELKTKPFDEVMKKYEPEKPKPAPKPAQPAPQPQVKPPSVQTGNNLLNKNEDDDYEDDDFDEDDYEDSEDFSSLTAKKQHSGKSFSIRCPRCSKTEEISDKRDIRSRDLGLICDKCGEAFVISFFGSCEECGEKVGFEAESTGGKWMSAGLTLLNSINNAMKPPKGLLAGIGESLFNAPGASSIGYCPFCTAMHLECPKCRSATGFPGNKDPTKDAVKCRQCGQKMKHPAF